MQLVKPFGFNRFKPVTQHGVIHGIEVLARIVHPQLFGEPALRDAVLK